MSITTSNILLCLFLSRFPNRSLNDPCFSISCKHFHSKGNVQFWRSSEIPSRQATLVFILFLLILLAVLSFIMMQKQLGVLKLPLSAMDKDSALTCLSIMMLLHLRSIIFLQTTLEILKKGLFLGYLVKNMTKYY